MPVPARPASTKCWLAGGPARTAGATSPRSPTRAPACRRAAVARRQAARFAHHRCLSAALAPPRRRSRGQGASGVMRLRDRAGVEAPTRAGGVGAMAMAGLQIRDGLRGRRGEEERRCSRPPRPPAPPGWHRPLSSHHSAQRHPVRAARPVGRVRPASSVRPARPPRLGSSRRARDHRQPLFAGPGETRQRPSPGLGNVAPNRGLADWI